MAYRQDHYEILATALGAMPGLSEKKMFGGICFLLNGNMLTGVFRMGGMARVGKERMTAALAIDGVERLSFTGRKMSNWAVQFGPDVLEDEARLNEVLGLAFAFVGPMAEK